MSITIYGIPNCDTTKKGLQLLQKRKVDFVFHDYKQTGVTAEKLQQWIDKAGLDKVFNKRSSTYKDLPAAEQAKATTVSGAVELMIKHNSIIKRPIVEANDELIIGYDEKKLNNLH